MADMRSLIRLFVGLLVLSIGLSVQAQTSFTCETGETFDRAIRVTLPESGDDPDTFDPEDLTPPGYFFTVMGLDDTAPMLYIEEGEDLFYCVPPPTAYYDVDLPVVGTQPGGENTAQVYLLPPGDLSPAFATLTDDRRYLMILEGGSSDAADGDGDVVSFEFDPATVSQMIAYVLPVDETYDPAISLIDDTGEVLLDADETPVWCDDAGDPETCYGESESLAERSITDLSFQTLSGTENSAMLTIPPENLSDGVVQLRVERNNSNGDYVLAVYLAPPPVEQTVVTATLETQTDDDGVETQQLACDGEVIAGELLIFDLPPLADTSDMYTITALSDETLNPLLATFTPDGAGICYDDTSAAADYEVLLPGVQLIASEEAAQGTLSAAGGQVAVPYPDEAQQLALLIEGAVYTADVASDPARSQVYALQLPENLAGQERLLTTFMIAADNEFDPYLVQVDENGDAVSETGAVAEATADPPADALPEATPDPMLMPVTDGIIACDNAGLPDMCQEGTTTLTDFFLTLADGQILLTYPPDAMLFPRYEEMPGVVRLRAETSPLVESVGTYLLVYHFVTP